MVYTELFPDQQSKANKKIERSGRKGVVMPPRYEPVTYAQIDTLRQGFEMKTITQSSHEVSTVTWRLTKDA